MCSGPHLTTTPGNCDIKAWQPGPKQTVCVQNNPPPGHKLSPKRCPYKGIPLYTHYTLHTLHEQSVHFIPYCNGLTGYTVWILLITVDPGREGNHHAGWTLGTQGSGGFQTSALVSSSQSEGEANDSHCTCTDALEILPWCTAIGEVCPLVVVECLIRVVTLRGCSAHSFVSCQCCGV